MKVDDPMAIANMRKSGMKVVYAMEEFPSSFTKAIFLVGPTPRSEEVSSWRPDALRILEEKGYDGVVFVPETADGEWKHNYDEQIEWEDKGLQLADVIVCWVPRDLKTMPAFTTNHEHGEWYRSGKTVLGCPDFEKTPKMRYLLDKGRKVFQPQAETLEETLDFALEMLGEGSYRFGGETEVPLHIWRTASFQSWYRAQRRAGNRLDGAREEWTFRVGPKKSFLFLWVLHVNVHVASEGRNKTNEVVIGRSDISCVVLHGPQRGLDTDVVLIREFRSPATTPDGFIHEVPGGSSFKPGKDPAQLAVDEVHEETGLELAMNRITVRSKRQLNGTLSSHKAHLYSAQLTDDEIAVLRDREGIALGEEGDSERTYVEVMKLGSILRSQHVDWSMLGMILSVIQT